MARLSRFGKHSRFQRFFCLFDQIGFFKKHRIESIDKGFILNVQDFGEFQGFIDYLEDNDNDQAD
jgi:hypothetical protein